MSNGIQKKLWKTTSVVVLLLSSCLLVQAQDNKNAPGVKGWGTEGAGPTASVTISGSSSNVSGMIKFDGSIGYNFTKNFGIEAGVPYLFDTRPGIFAGTTGRQGYVSIPFVSCSFFFGCYTGVSNSSRLWAGELGDVWADVHYTRPYKKYNFATVLTGDAPTASYRKGLTTGRVEADWFNHIDTDFHGFSPFVNFGLATGRMDQHLLARPFQTNLPFRTHGYMADGEAGLQYKFWRRLTLGGSFWDVLPMGPQKIYSNLVWQDASPGVLTVGPGGAAGFGIVQSPPFGTGVGDFGYIVGDPNHGRYWNSAFETRGPARIARDNGYTGVLAFSPFKAMDVQIAYNHSVRYHMDGVMLTLQFNANGVFRKITNY